MMKLQKFPLFACGKGRDCLLIFLPNGHPKAKTYANVIKAVTKITRIENEKKNTMKKMTTTNMTATKKKLTLKIKNDVEKKRLRNITNVEFLKRIKRIIEESKNETIKLN